MVSAINFFSSNQRISRSDLVITDKMVTILLLYASGYQATTRTRNIRLGLFVIFAQKVVDEF